MLLSDAESLLIKLFTLFFEFHFEIAGRIDWYLQYMYIICTWLYVIAFVDIDIGGKFLIFSKG